MSNLNSLRDQAFQIARAHGFSEATIGEEIALMHSELSEALEDYRDGHSPNESWYIDKATNERFSRQAVDLPRLKPCGIPSEMADVIIRVLHFCGKHGINIEKAVYEKMAYNERREYMHGKKL